MNIRTEVREIEKHINNLSASTKAEKIAIISRAQSLAAGDEHSITVLAIVKNRIIRQYMTNNGKR